jgi:FlaA1/EpsC-like NDP-sugar epimerase
VRNNAIATRVVAHVAGELGVEAFVLVSTDKAVAGDRDGGLEGARRVRGRGGAAALPQRRATCAVRFGNVLGSSGSVVPIFRRQIAAAAR